MIKELLKSIPQHLRTQLMFAFEQDMEQLVELDDDKFLGVNIVETNKLAIEEVAGKFFYGRIIK